MKTTQTTIPTADAFIQGVQEETFSAAVFYTEYFYTAKPTDTDCRVLLLTKYNSMYENSFVLVACSYIHYMLIPTIFFAAIHFHLLPDFKTKNILC